MAGLIQQLWSCPDETASEVEMGDFLYGLVRMLKPLLVVETGSYLGHATARMGLALCQNKRGRLVSCDTVQEHVAEARLKTKNFPVDVRHCSSLDLPELSQADLIFSDSDYKFRSQELCRARKDAIIVVHDTRISYDSSIEPLEGLLTDLGGICFPTYRGFGILKKEH